MKRIPRQPKKERVNSRKHSAQREGSKKFEEMIIAQGVDRVKTCDLCVNPAAVLPIANVTNTSVSCQDFYFNCIFSFNVIILKFQNLNKHQEKKPQNLIKTQQLGLCLYV